MKFKSKLSATILCSLLLITLLLSSIGMNVYDGDGKTHLSEPTSITFTVSGTTVNFSINVGNPYELGVGGFKARIIKNDVEPNEFSEWITISSKQASSNPGQFTGLKSGTYMIQAYAYTNNTATYADSDWVFSADITVKASDSGESGGSGGSGGSGSSDAPGLDKGKVWAFSVTPGVATIDMTGYDHGIGIEIYNGSTKIISKLLGYYGSHTIYVNIPYDQTTTFKYRVFRYDKYSTSWGTVSVTSAKLKKPTLSVTKISAKKAGLKWSKIAGATGYKIYMGSKVIKILGSDKTAYIHTGKKAGSKKYSVQPIITISAKKTFAGPKSNAMKGKGNFRTYSGTSSTDSMSYGRAGISPKKVVLSGNKYKVTFFAKNSRIFKLIKFKKLEITLLCDGKKVAHKTFKNYKLNLKQNRSKKITVNIKGKGGVDFRNAEGITIRWNVIPYWEIVGSKAF